MAGVSSFVTGRKSSIGTSAVQLTATSIHASRGVQIVADSSLCRNIYSDGRFNRCH